MDGINYLIMHKMVELVISSIPVCRTMRSSRRLAVVVSAVR